MKTTGPFYLSVIDKPVSNVWFKKTPMGKNTIDSIMKIMKLNSPLIDLRLEKRITNHSARKTVVKKLKSSGTTKMQDQEYHGTHFCAGSRWLRFWWWSRAANDFKYHRQQRSCYVNRSIESTLSCKVLCVTSLSSWPRAQLQQLQRHFEHCRW